jgi:hypothetical protein
MISTGYTKPDQTAFAANLSPHETVVTLDTGQNIAVWAQCGVEPNTGNPVLTANARAVNADGTDYTDAVGQTVKTCFSHTSNADEVAEVGGMAALQKIAMLAVLGESTAPLYTDPVHAQSLSDWSIRTNLASAAHAGPVTDAGALL